MSHDLPSSIAVMLSEDPTEQRAIDSELARYPAAEVQAAVAGVDSYCHISDREKGELEEGRPLRALRFCLDRLYEKRIARNLPPTPETAAPEALRVFSLEELLAMEPRKQRFLVDGLVPLGGITALSARKGRWKTWVMDHLALCVAGEKHWFGKFPTVPGRVLLLALEGGIDEHMRRIKALHAGMDMPPNAPLFTYEGPLTAENAKQRNLLENAIRKYKPDLVAVDHMRALFGGLEDDSARARDIQIFIREMQAIQPSTWFILAHEGKNGTTIRGSSGQEDILDGQLSIERKHRIGTLSSSKVRSGPEAPSFDFQFVGPEQPGGAGLIYLGDRAEEEEGASRDSESDQEQRIIDALRTAGGTIPRKDLVEQLESVRFSEHSIDRALTRLEKAKRVRRGDRDGRKIPIHLVDM